MTESAFPSHGSGRRFNPYSAHEFRKDCHIPYDFNGLGQRRCRLGAIETLMVLGTESAAVL